MELRLGIDNHEMQKDHQLQIHRKAPADFQIILLDHLLMIGMEF